MSYIQNNIKNALKNYESKFNFNEDSLMSSDIVNSLTTLKTRLADYEKAVNSQAMGAISAT